MCDFCHSARQEQVNSAKEIRSSANLIVWQPCSDLWEWGDSATAATIVIHDTLPEEKVRGAGWDGMGWDGVGGQESELGARLSHRSHLETAQG